MEREKTLEEALKALDKEKLIEYLHELFAKHPQFAQIYDNDFEDKDIKSLLEIAISAGHKALRLSVKLN